MYRKKHVSTLDVALAAAASVLLSFIVWQTIDPRAVVFFAMASGIAELFIVLRWRLSIACPHCGFDPVLYKRNRERAVVRVKEHMARRREDPMFAFAPPPRLPVIVKKKAAPMPHVRSGRSPAPTPAKRSSSTRSIRA